MRVSLTANAVDGVCSKCGAGDRGLGPVQVIPFTIIVDGHAGETEALCQGCLFYPDGVKADVPMQNLAAGVPARRGKALKKARKVSLEQELDVMEQLGGYRQPGSGNQRGKKGDGRVKDERAGLRVETKFTEAESFSLKLDELYKIAGEATGGEKPIFVIDYLENGTRRLKDRFAVLHFDDLKELLNDSGQHR